MANLLLGAISTGIALGFSIDGGGANSRSYQAKIFLD